MNKLKIAAILGLVLASIATVAVAHHGNVTGYADCDSWHVSATIYETSENRRIVVTSTIPGTTGLDATGYSAGEDGTEVWSATGASPVSGTVTLDIWYGDQLENSSSLTIESPSDCQTPTPEPTPVPSIPDTSTTAPPSTGGNLAPLFLFGSVLLLLAVASLEYRRR
jgi:hypothetical protein